MASKYPYHTGLFTEAAKGLFETLNLQFDSSNVYELHELANRKLSYATMPADKFLLNGYRAITNVATFTVALDHEVVLNISNEIQQPKIFISNAIAALARYRCHIPCETWALPFSKQQALQKKRDELLKTKRISDLPANMRYRELHYHINLAELRAFYDFFADNSGRLSLIPEEAKTRLFGVPLDTIMCEMLTIAIGEFKKEKETYRDDRALVDGKCDRELADLTEKHRRLRQEAEEKYHIMLCGISEQIDQERTLIKAQAAAEMLKVKLKHARATRELNEKFSMVMNDPKLKSYKLTPNHEKILGKVEKPDAS